MPFLSIKSANSPMIMGVSSYENNSKKRGSGSAQAVQTSCVIVWLKAFLALTAMVLPATATLAQTDPRTNYFNAPFLQATRSIAGCPVPEGPLYTAQEVRDVAHVRVQHGGSCYRVGRCRLPNSYLYDAEIIPRVSTYIQGDGRFGNTSVWLLGERRIVTLMGCVQSAEQSQALEKAVLLVDDVMGVVNFLMVGTQEKTPYKTTYESVYKPALEPGKSAVGQ
jgi:hypothetical protein